MTPAFIPRGIEVLVRKAAVDPEFKDLLLKKRAEAAKEIGLKLEPAEILMLHTISVEQLEKTISGTQVPEEHRRVFLGKVAAAMLAALGVMSPGCNPLPVPKGIAPDRPREKQKEDAPPPPPKMDFEPTKGILPDRPKTEPES
jgi:hypothetical protein